ncbi:hypothetical protein V2W45_1234265, partial [Cenococcum geophilum]
QKAIIIVNTIVLGVTGHFGADLVSLRNYRRSRNLGLSLARSISTRHVKSILTEP